MKKNIDIPDDIRWELEALALQEKKDLKTKRIQIYGSAFQKLLKNILLNLFG